VVPFPRQPGDYARGIRVKRGGNLSMLTVNPIGNQAVLGGDERRSLIRDARRCDE